LKSEYRNKPIADRIEIKPIRSNLGKGWVYYFICPVTGYNCRKLYLDEGKFKSRIAIKGILYKQQEEPKKQRQRLDIIRKYNRYSKMVDATFKPYHKPKYEGIKTKKQIKAEWASSRIRHMSRLLA